MHKLIASLLAISLITAPSIAQQTTYTTISEMTAAAQQASNGQLAMTSGGYLGGDLPVTPAVTAASDIAITAAPNLDRATNEPGENRTALIAALVGAAVIVFPLLINLLGDND